MREHQDTPEAPKEYEVPELEEYGRIEAGTKGLDPSDIIDNA